MANPEAKSSIRSIARNMKKSYTLVYNNIVNLEKKGIISKESVPPAHIITISEFAPENIIVNAELKRKEELLETHAWIKVMMKDIVNSSRNIFFVLMIFGSYAKKSQKKDSDIDILAVVQDKRYISKIEDAIRNAYTKARKSINVVTVEDFTEMIRNTEEFNIGNEARKYHILLQGAEMYYQLSRGAKD